MMWHASETRISNIVLICNVRAEEPQFSIVCRQIHAQLVMSLFLFLSLFSPYIRLVLKSIGSLYVLVFFDCVCVCALVYVLCVCILSFSQAKLNASFVCDISE